VVKTTVLGKEYYTLNRDVARRYFSKRDAGIPEAQDDLFEIKKQPNTKRIFMLGESTMAGFPFDYNATAPRLLADRLKQTLPQYNIEVINTGLAAVNSYTVLDLAKELVEYEPDAFIVYVGHNEFYGAMGVGSTEYFGQWRWAINLTLKLRALKLFLLVKDGIASVRSLISGDVTPAQSSLMETMVREKIILYNSNEYQTARKNYEANLRDLIELSKEKNIPIVISTLTSNIKDQKPLEASFSENATEPIVQQWTELMKKGNDAEQSGNIGQAKDLYQQAITTDSMQADAYFALGRCTERESDFTTAKLLYEKARDYDGLRFRATSDFNHLVRTICKELNVSVADAESAFEKSSPNDIVGMNLMLEHLHPNFDGYFLLAKTFFETIADNNILVPKNEFRWNWNLSDDEFKRRSGVTRFDIEAANFRIFGLMHSWPFVKTGKTNEQYPVTDKASELAVQYAKKGLAWSKARYDLADWYRSNNDYSNALNEYRALSKVMWYHYKPFMYMADMYRELSDTLNAEKHYLHSLLLDETPFVHVRLGMMYYDNGKTEKAIEQFEATFTSEVRSSEQMNKKDRSLARYFLAASYWKQGNTQSAIANLETSVQLDPNNAEARSMLTQLRQQQ
jgi:tetratricopeptide (TPR) repeat protein